MRLAAGDRIDFVLMEDGHYAVVPATQSVKSLKGIILRPAKPVSLEDMQSAIEEGASGK
jgi:hypothetical protein